MTATQAATERSRPAEQTRARLPDGEGHVERDGVRVCWERHGDGEPTLLLLPAWSLIHSRQWKAQVPYLARHYRVVTYDPRGNGRSDRPATAEAYDDEQFVADAVAVLEATGTERAVLVALSRGGRWAAELAAARPELVLGAVLIDPAFPTWPRSRAGRPSRSTRSSTPPRAGPSTTATTGCASTGTSWSSSPPRPSPRPTPPSRSRTWWAGGWRRAPRPWS
jgi:pimeloyl-ACP methyl ester carboxylesterase